MIQTIDTGTTIIKGNPVELFVEMAATLSAYRRSAAKCTDEETALQLVVLIGKLSMAEMEGNKEAGDEIVREAVDLMDRTIKSEYRKGNE